MLCSAPQDTLATCDNLNKHVSVTPAVRDNRTYQRWWWELAGFSPQNKAIQDSQETCAVFAGSGLKGCLLRKECGAEVSPYGLQPAAPHTSYAQLRLLVRQQNDFKLQNHNSTADRVPLPSSHLMTRQRRHNTSIPNFAINIQATSTKPTSCCSPDDPTAPSPPGASAHPPPSLGPAARSGCGRSCTAPLRR